MFLGVDPLTSRFPWISPFAATNCNPVRYIDADGRAAVPPDDHYINLNGSIQTVKTSDNYDRFFVQDHQSETGYRLAGKLEINDAGLVLFPSQGQGFDRYGLVDAGGKSASPAEVVGRGDHYLKPESAAALFGLMNKLNSTYGFTLSLGDMSSSNGSDPWQPGAGHHKGHGHLGIRSGLDVDFRYLTKDKISFQDGKRGQWVQGAKGGYFNDIGSSLFSYEFNTQLYSTAGKFGFTNNFQGTNGNLLGVKKVGGHDDHGHLGLDYNNLNWQYVRDAPIKQSNNFNFYNR